jgi:hypothetical protein
MISEKQKVISEWSAHLSLFVFHLSLLLRGLMLTKNVNYTWNGVKSRFLNIEYRLTNFEF